MPFTEKHRAKLQQILVESYQSNGAPSNSYMGWGLATAPANLDGYFPGTRHRATQRAEEQVCHSYPGVDSSSSSAASGTVAVALLLCTPLAQSTTNPVWALRTSLHVKTGRTKLKTARLWTGPRVVLRTGRRTDCAAAVGRY